MVTLDQKQKMRRRQKKKGKKQKPRYSQPPLMDRHNRGDLREDGQRKRKKKKTTEPRGSEKLEKLKTKKKG